MKIFQNIKTYAALGSLALLTIVETGCKKQLDINQSPNVPTLSQGNPSLVFPAAVLQTTGTVGGNLEIVGGIWSQYFTQSTLANQYTTIESYNMSTIDGFTNATWTSLFTNGLKNYQYCIDQSKASSDWTFYLMSTVMKAYTAEVMVDLYDQMPYSEALQGATNLQPKFDDGYTIYQNLINEIDTAMSKDFTASTNSVPGAQDIIFQGNVPSWLKFANSLKLKMYLRMINAHADVANSGVTAMLGANAAFLDIDAGVSTFSNAPGLDNPFYEQNQRQLNTTTNLKASTTFVSWLEANNDPRITFYFGSATPSSINQGDYTNNNSTYQAAPVFAQSPTDPVHFISLAESFFMQAEANLRYSDGSNAQTLYNQGVLNAFSDVGLDGTSLVAAGGVYEFPTAGTLDQKIQAISVQKWASCAYGCHAMEAFFEKNRTGYPVSSPVYSTDPSYVPGQLVIGKNSVLAPGLVPKRFVFPYDETTRNKNSPALVPISTPVWWGK
jgi:hypothetical protein